MLHLTVMDGRLGLLLIFEEMAASFSVDIVCIRTAINVLVLVIIIIVLIPDIILLVSLIYIFTRIIISNLLLNLGLLYFSLASVVATLVADHASGRLANFKLGRSFLFAIFSGFLLELLDSLVCVLV